MSGPPTTAAKASPGVRERRLSGTHITQLKIETNAVPALEDGAATRNGLSKSAASPAIPPYLLSELPLTPLDGQHTPNRIATASNSPHHKSPRAESSSSAEAALPDSAANMDPNSAAAVMSGLTKVTSMDAEVGQPSSPGRFTAKTLGLRKNFSSSSLKSKNSSSVPHDPLESTSVVPSAMQRRGPPTALSSTSTFNVVGDRPPTDGINLFDSDIHSPVTPGLPNRRVANPPLPLEPCPELPLLRPFWFLRCIYQTIAHPRGGYISTRLFIPSSIWRVKNVKLKSVDEKVSACDLLSAALSKLAKVNTFDADAVLEEMQFLENVMEQAQANLSKKLGNEVGVVGTSSLFKGSSAIEDGSLHTETSMSKSSNSHGKSYLSSWRKLRPKTSGPGSFPSSGASTLRDGSKDGLTFESLPMTSLPDPKFPKRDLGRIRYEGPHSTYMAALARLCDAAQVLGKWVRSSCR